MPEYITHFSSCVREKKQKGTCFTWKEPSLTLRGILSSSGVTVTEGTRLPGTYG